jgi:hypothetical protein
MSQHAEFVTSGERERGGDRSFLMMRLVTKYMLCVLVVNE